MGISRPRDDEVEVNGVGSRMSSLTTPISKVSPAINVEAGTLVGIHPLQMVPASALVPVGAQTARGVKNRGTAFSPVGLVGQRWFG